MATVAPNKTTAHEERLNPYLAAIIGRLQPLRPARIILFGSQAAGEADANSDLDLIVVLDSDRMPATYREKEDLYLQVLRLLRDIRNEIPIDVIVHTRPMHARFLETAGAFAREVQEKGIVLYEGHHA